MAAVWRSVSEALWAMCAADAMSMPVHWYYNIHDIKKDFGGWISGFNSPKIKHPSSILNLSNTAGSGRTSWSSASKRVEVVGNIILHDKLSFWKSSSGSIHYHQGLKAGNNTLNVLCALRAARTLASSGFTDISHPDARAAVLVDYVNFLTTPGTHADTYAESSHRSFFADWQDSRPKLSQEVLIFAEERAKKKLMSLPDSQLDAIGCLTAVLPFILQSASTNEEQAVCAAVEFGKLLHPHPSVPEYVSIYSRALHAVLQGASVRQQAEIALRTLGVWDTCEKFSQRAARFPMLSEERLQVHQIAVSSLGLACYTKGALSSMFYLAHQFHDDPTAGILANTNCGGENCNRGAALGALLGAGGSYTKSTIPQDWKDQLRDAQDYIPDIIKYLQH
ncbi:uncharacterized protein LOC130931057 [Corythoichthys intestinalis]|uniref:uncharacterized protein LOC130931057 n=1 Tax=Corythoichthys intestinalis TaxID=161448 RepID=UPI0025A612A7|nr:uncharacterized protein LOC130931057 [Corythoichthys intestinalis]XP_057715524.1 uncharacterized protein LOC130931057 [Corythoichthys intestinalis]